MAIDFAPDVLTTMPSTTGVAWASIFTGVTPAEHGFAGNEFFVLPVADAFHRNNVDGNLVPGMKDTLDLVLTRRPVAFAEADLPFEVCVGNGKTEPLAAYLEAHPHPSYTAFASRLRERAVGLRGERAGDVLLLAHNGDRERPDERYYFASPYVELQLRRSTSSLVARGAPP